MRIKILRRVIGIIALVLLVMGLMCIFILDDGSHLIYQIDVWIYRAAFFMVVIYGILCLFYAIRNLHWALKLLISVVAVLGIGYFLFVAAIVGVLGKDTRIWSNDRYVVYHEPNSMIDPGLFVMYKQDGLIEKPCYTVGSEFGNPDKYECFFDEERDFIRIEADWTFDVRSWHTTTFYRLSDGKLYVHQNPMDSSLWSGRYSSYDKNTSLRQQLEVESVHDTLIFNYYIDLRDVKLDLEDGEKEYTLKGRAFLKKGDAETDEDKHGNAYLVDEYIYEDEDHIAFRIQAVTHDIIRVVVDDATAARYHIPTSSIFR